MAPERNILAIGGSEFRTEPLNPLLDDYLLGLTGKHRPRVCFVPTAGGDDAASVRLFYDLFARRSDATWLPLFNRGRVAPRDLLLEQDLIYVGGGNTANMLAIWRLHGVDTTLREAWDRGIVLAGWSAGAICWFESGVTDSFGPDLGPLDAMLGFLPGSFCPHYDAEERRRPTYERLVAEGRLPGGWAADDGAAVHFAGDRVEAAVSSRPAARAYRIEAKDGRATETALETRFLGRSRS
ncbi:MAG TPA: peptidase E [Candidatus Limnocylindrales bacterium]